MLASQNELLKQEENKAEAEMTEEDKKWEKHLCILQGELKCEECCMHMMFQALAQE